MKSKEKNCFCGCSSTLNLCSHCSINYSVYNFFVTWLYAFLFVWFFLFLLYQENRNSKVVAKRRHYQFVTKRIPGDQVELFRWINIQDSKINNYYWLVRTQQQTTRSNYSHCSFDIVWVWNEFLMALGLDTELDFSSCC